MGSDEDWEMATDALRGALDDLGLDYVVNEGDGAFYEFQRLTSTWRILSGEPGSAEPSSWISSCHCVSTVNISEMTERSTARS